MKSVNVKPILLRGGSHTDKRGAVGFFNSFDMTDVKRVYTIKHVDTSIIRAWQGHRHEQKWFHVAVGSFKMALIQPDNWSQPSSLLKPAYFYLSSERPEILHVPKGYATGFCAGEENSVMFVYSDATVEESQNDDYRFDKDMWCLDW